MTKGVLMLSCLREATIGRWPVLLFVGDGRSDERVYARSGK